MAADLEIIPASQAQTGQLWQFCDQTGIADQAATQRTEAQNRGCSDPSTGTQ